MSKEEYRICARCVMDTTDPAIEFDDRGFCTHCRGAEEQLRQGVAGLPPVEKEQRLQALLTQVRDRGKGAKHDCIIGVSGGIDSTYAAYLVKKAGLRPLAVHFDNGWDAELAVKNIENICKRLEIELFTYVVDWEEFKDLQLSFLRASVPDAEIPSDHAIQAILYQTAAQEKVGHILAGTNAVTESILPAAWSQGHGDWKYIKAVHRQFGTRPLKTFPHFSHWQHLAYWRIHRLKWISFLDYVEYDKEKAKKVVESELGWRDYGSKHHESVYTKFFQAYILPRKFGYDKRKAHLSSLICAGQLTREQAMQELQRPLYPPDRLKEDIEYVANKLGITPSELDRLMDLPPRTYHDFPNSEHFTSGWSYRVVRRIYRLFKRKAAASQ